MKDEDEGVARRRAFLRSRSESESVQDDIARYVGADQVLHASDLAAVCRTVAEILESHPDREGIPSWQDPRSPEAEALWLEPFRRSRLHGGDSHLP